MAKGFKTGGREQGTPNRLTKELRTLLKDIVFNELANLPENLEKLETKDRLELTYKFARLVIPQPEPVNPFTGEGWGTDI
jgi:hypothetical protein